MALVQYSDSDPESDEDDLGAQSPPKKKTHQAGQVSPSIRKEPALPPLPSTFHDLYASNTRVSLRDDPSLHGGRKRAIPHVEGNWPTHIYLEWYPSRTELPVLEDILQKCEIRLSHGDRMIHSLLHSDLGVQLPLHISLSRPVVLATEQKHPFIEHFKRSIDSSGICPFEVVPGSLDWVSNYEQSRWFLVLRIKAPENDTLNKLLRISNRSLAAFGQPPLYETIAASPQQVTSEKNAVWRSKQAQKTPVSSDSGGADCSHCFHISIAWCLEEPSQEDKQQVANLDMRPLSTLKISFNSVKAKIGNVVTSKAFPVRKEDSNGFGRV